MKKTCKIKRDERIEAVKQKIVDGYSSSQIIKFCFSEYDAATRTASAYITEAKAKISNSLSLEQKNYYKNIAIERFTNVYKLALKDQKYNAAILAQSELCKILGLYEPEDKSDTQINITYTKAE